MLVPPYPSQGRGRVRGNASARRRWAIARGGLSGRLAAPVFGHASGVHQGDIAEPTVGSGHDLPVALKERAEIADGLLLPPLSSSLSPTIYLHTCGIGPLRIFCPQNFAQNRGGIKPRNGPFPLGFGVIRDILSPRGLGFEILLRKVVHPDKPRAQISVPCHSFWGLLDEDKT
jgi:hypothetical protein